MEDLENIVCWLHDAMFLTFAVIIVCVIIFIAYSMAKDVGMLPELIIIFIICGIITAFNMRRKF